MQANETTVRQEGDVDYQKLRFPYVRSQDQDAAPTARRPVVIVGAGPVGLSLAIDLAQRQVPVVLLESSDCLSVGSRALCFAKRTLEIFDRLGCGDRMVNKGVSWNLGKVFFKEEQVFSFDLLPEPGHANPAFVNLQQYYVEGYLAERAAELPLIDMRWKNEIVGVEQHDDHAMLTINTPDGPYQLEAEYVAACDGSRSAMRRLIGQESKGRTFRDRFLIADVKMSHHAPAERWFWFDPVFHPNQSVLLHRQPDGVWRIDFQLGWDADPEEEKKPENILPRVKALLAHSPMKDADITLEWASVYTFACLRMDKFRHGRVIFAGDSAHGVSPFGARGANSGVQDAENLAWKLKAVLSGQAPDALLDTYAQEREYAADENIRNSTRATDFITPKSDISRLFRDAVLELSKTQPFARTLVNSGRLSVPATLHGSSLNTPDSANFAGRMEPGSVASDAPVVCTEERGSWLLRELGPEFTLLVAADPHNQALQSALRALKDTQPGLKVIRVATSVDLAAVTADADLLDRSGQVFERYDLRPGTAYLIRPDQHVCARWREVSADKVEAAIAHALALA